MKRALMLFLAGVLLNTLAIAQVVDLNQRGRATQELKAEGYNIAHPKLPLYSKVMVENTQTGKQIEVTVSDRIPASSSRIADLSYSAWRELGLTANSEIRIFTPPVVRQRPPVKPPEEPVYNTDPEVVAKLSDLESKVDRYPSGEELIDRLTSIIKTEIPQPEKYDDSEIRAQLTNIENKVDAYPSEEDLMGRLTAIIKSEMPQPEKYDDSEIRAQLTNIENKVDAYPSEEDLMGRLTAIIKSEMPQPEKYDDSEIKSQLANIENKVDAYPSEEDLIDRLAAMIKSEMPQPEKYDDSEIKSQLTNIENKVDRYPSEEELIDRLVSITRSETPQPESYDDSEIKAKLAALEAREKEREAAVMEAAARETAARAAAEAAREAAVKVDAPRQEAARSAQAAPVNSPPAAALPQIQEFVMAPVNNPQIIPGYPNPDSGKNYRLQVGAFSMQETATIVAQLVGSIGFDVVLEQDNSVYRVLAINVPANVVYPATQRLANLGVKQIWIREQ